MVDGKWKMSEGRQIYIQPVSHLIIHAIVQAAKQIMLYMKILYKKSN